MRKKSVSCVNIRKKFDAKSINCGKKSEDRSLFICNKKIDGNFLPLLESAGSLSSFNSFTPATEVSFLESSEDDPKISDNEKPVVYCRSGKMRRLKHRSRSMSLSERSINCIQENMNCDNEYINCKLDTMKNQLKNQKNKPKKDNNNIQVGESPVDIVNISFSKEQRKRLKQKMRETQKFPDKSVFLGTF